MNNNKKIAIRISALFILIIFVVGIFSDPLFAQTQTTEKNVGFPARGVWFSKSSFLEGEEVLIHVIVFNDASGTFSGTTEFHDSATLLGKVPFTITNTQKVKVVSLKWKATAGDHRISANITDPKLTLSNGTVIHLTLPDSKTSESPIFVEQDLNHNLIADSAEPKPTTTPPTAESEVFGRGADMVKNAVPESVKSVTGNIFTHVDNFREQEHGYVEVARVDNIAQIDALNQKEIAMIAAKGSAKSNGQQNVATSTPEFGGSDHIERPLRYVYWAFLVLSEAILGHPWLFYIILFFVCYSILRALWRKIRSSGV